MKFRSTFRFLWPALCLANVAAAEQLAIDPGHSAVVFSWTVRGYAHPMARLEQISGEVALDVDLAKSTVVVTLPIDGLHTGNPLLDRRLRGRDFFEVERFREIRFESRRVELGPDSRRLRVTGDLTVHGVTRQVTLDTTLNRIFSRGGRTIAGFDADLVLRRSDFGLGRYVPMVGDEVTIHVSVESVGRG